MLNLIKARFILLACMLGITPSLSAQIVSITIAPPPLVVYEQPPCPEDGYFWIPGYWAYGDDDYYWVPGVWVAAPEPGFLWTPGYWGFAGGGYVWHTGYWGPRIGFYGGINYGFGYYGSEAEHHGATHQQEHHASKPHPQSHPSQKETKKEK
jgi:hypothetical protein